ncbi:MAG: dienelactone hydrolase family protein [Dehalococcoidales bacterium]|nr:dienelactone hydrolase family protein [Dehalococcoidales bacterium]
MEKTKVLDVCPVSVNTGKVTLEGDLCVPFNAYGVVVFAHSSGSSRHNQRNRYLAQVLRQFGLATLLFDLFTEEEEKTDLKTGRYRFDIRMLANRLVGTTEWLKQNPETKGMNIGYFGAGNGAAAALMAAAEHPNDIGAVVSRGGRPDLARSALPYVKSPTLLIVSGRDLPVMAMNRDAFAELRAEKKIIVIPGVNYLDEPGVLEEVAMLATNWFANYLNRKLSVASGVAAAWQT